LAIEAGKIATNTITASQMAANSIGTDELIAGAVTAGILATNAVIADKIAANAVTTAKIAAGAITADEILAGTITADKIVVGGITTDRLANNFIEKFDGLNIGDIDGQGSYPHVGAWDNQSGSGCTANVAVRSGADKMLVLLDNSATELARAYLTLDAGYEIVTGVVSFQMRQSHTNKNSRFAFYQGTDMKFSINFESDGNIWWRVIYGDEVNIQSYAAGTWYTFKIHFDCFARVAAVYINGVYKERIVLSDSFGVKYINHFRLWTHSTDAGSYQVWFDNFEWINLTIA